ncbi:Ig-like domain-containing protein, partial [bacterium]|nr:Ig-like domain-containing protein [bacterium]
MKAGIIQRTLVPVISLLYFCTLLSCDNDTNEYNEQTKITIVSGNNQSERVGVVLPEPMTVLTTDILGNLRPGIQVYFSTNDSGAVVTPSSTITDTDGFATCRFQLGFKPGEQHVSVASENEGMTFIATAEELQCPEESPETINQWPSGHIFITTNYSSFITGTGSVLIDFDPENKHITKVLETDEIIIDLSFSSRGELFVASDTEIFRVTPDLPHELESYVSPPSEMQLELKANPGGVLVGISQNSVFTITCPGEGISGIYTLSGILPENLAVDPINRDLFIIDKANNHYN